MSAESANYAQELPDISAPPLRLLLREARIFPEMGRYYFRGMDLERLPKGGGQPIMIVPGFGASDWGTRPLRRALNELGFAAHGWGQGYNWGMRPGMREALAARVEALQTRHGRKVALLGWSLGGVFVREMARHAPSQVSMVFTLGSPINGHPNANNVAKLFNLMNPGKKVDADLEGFRKRRVPPPVPCVAVHSKTDGIVAWQCAREMAAPNTENVEVQGSHFGYVSNPQVLAVVARRLASVD